MNGSGKSETLRSWLPMPQTSHPPGAQMLVPTEQGHVEKGPFGPDITQSISSVGPDAGLQGKPDLGMLDIQRTAALGRAKGILAIAQGLESADREALIDALFVRLIDFAIYGADIETVLNGLR